MKLKRSDIIRIVIVLVIFGGAMVAGFLILSPKKQLPIYNPSQLDKRLVDNSLQNSGKGHHTLPFALLDQNGDTITDKDLEGKIYVADFFFTTCPGICKDMAGQKRRLQKVFKDDANFMIVSHTVTPEIDSVPVMHKYAELQGAIPGKWELLTGNKKEIYKLARKSYFAVIDSGGNGDENDFIHTENFVLVDPQKRIRGFYDGTSEEAVDKLIDDVGTLEEEQHMK